MRLIAKLFGALALLAALAVSSWATPAIVQTCTNQAYASTAISCAFSSNAAAGDTIIVSDGGAAFSANGVTATTAGCSVSSWVTDETDSTQGDSFIAAHGTTAGGACTVTITFSAAPTDSAYILAVEVSGLSGTVDAKALAVPNGNGNASLTGVTATTTTAGDFVVAVLGPPANTGNSATAGAPFANTVAPGAGLSVLATLTQAAPGAISASYTLSGSTLDYMPNAIVAFEPSGSAPAHPPCTVALLGAGAC